MVYSGNKLNFVVLEEFMKDILLKIVKRLLPIVVGLAAIGFSSTRPFILAAEAVHFYTVLVDIQVGSYQTALVNDFGQLVECRGISVLWEERKFDIGEVTNHFVSWIGNHYTECNGTGDPGDLIIVSGELRTASGLPLAAGIPTSCGVSWTPCYGGVTQSSYHAEKVYAITHVQVYDAGQQRQFNLYPAGKEPKTLCFYPKDMNYSSSAGTETAGFVTQMDGAEYRQGTNAFGTLQAGSRNNQYIHIEGVVDPPVPTGRIKVTVSGLAENLYYGEAQDNKPGLGLMSSPGTGESPDLTADTIGQTVRAGQTVVLYGSPNATWPVSSLLAYFGLGSSTSSCCFMGPWMLEYRIDKVEWEYVYQGQTVLLQLYP